MTASLASLSRHINEAIALFLGSAADYEAHLTAEGFLVLTGEPAADVNMAGIWGGGEAKERMREFGARVAQRNLPVLLLTTVEQSEQIGDTAADFGFSHVGSVPLMIYEPTANLPGRSDYAVERVASEADRQQWLDTIAAAFALPPAVARGVWGPGLLDTPGLTLFLARTNGQAVSGVACTRRGTTVGIWAMGTPPERQRQGAGAAALSHAINHHRASGARLFYLMATEQGEPLYRKLGFQTVADLPVWVRGQSTQVPG
jgi:GNAT superfamily N-acetyltransferase